MMNNYRSYNWLYNLYFMQGISFSLITVVSPVLFKDFNFDNTHIAFYTSLLTLPWIFKFLLAPALEKFSKRNVVIYTQLCLSIFIILIAISFYVTYWYYLAEFLLILVAVMGAIYDISSDGLYLDTLNLHEQAKFIGIRTLFYQIGRLLCRCGLLLFVGVFITNLGKEKTWSLAFIMLAIVIFLLTLYQKIKLPASKNKLATDSSYQQAWRYLFHLPHLFAAIIFILLYELPEAQLTKIIPLYMLDASSHGGLALTVKDVGVWYGGISMISMLIGVTLSGILLNRFTFKKCLMYFSAISALSYTSYLLLYQNHYFGTLIFCIIVSGFGFGLNNGAYMFYIITVFAKKPYSMSLYTIGTAIMLLGMMLGGSISGYLQTWLGYNGFFVWIAILSVSTVGMAFYNSKRIL